MVSNPVQKQLFFGPPPLSGKRAQIKMRIYFANAGLVKPARVEDNFCNGRKCALTN